MKAAGYRTHSGTVDCTTVDRPIVVPQPDRAGPVAITAALRRRRFKRFWVNIAPRAALRRAVKTPPDRSAVRTVTRRIGADGLIDAFRSSNAAITMADAIRAAQRAVTE
ncbi:MAG: hypothetical protein ACREP7_09995, partial [Lysobacter sp.]